ncbi:MAG: thiamine pyrophosphate-binding protein [Bryobacterales bacterium]|nr:thiamine pyrophosphate-binding protein [Bryobacterales bacterium]MBV9400557.1 thiamine pyrophosphate-binding protein [Bryobacterales bacterium]
MARLKKSSLGRRNFIKGAAGGAAVLAAGAPRMKAQTPSTASRAAEPTASARQAESGTPSTVEVLTADRPGSDFMVDVLKQLGFEYVCANPGSSFRGLHESIVNYGGNRSPEFITCCHEESAVAMGHGYAKVEGKPLAVLLHGSVGAQHAAMAVYNAYCDRVPVYLISANLADVTSRRPGVEWAHSVQDGNNLLRDFVKWDDTPASLPHFAESAVRAYKIAMTPPMMPVALVADGDLQEDPHEAAWPRIPKLTLAAPPQGDSGAVAEAARLLVSAQSPVIIADRAARTSAGMKLLLELAETLQAPVIDQGGRMNFPSRHPLNHSERSRAAISDADVILGLELTDFWGTVNSFKDQLHRTSQPITKSGTKLISITAMDLFLKSNYQDFQRYPELDVAIAADAEATLPSLIEAVKRLLTDDRKRAFQDRGAKLAAASVAARERAKTDATYAWDASPISTARLSAELWAQIKSEDWSLVSEISFVSRWPMRLWNFDKPYQFLGGSGGAGVGYGAPSSVGAALANKKYGRFSVAIQNDGDLMYAPGVLWTAAHHRIPLLSVMHNNRAYHQEVMHVQRMATRHNRGITQANIGTTLDNPNIDYAKIAQGMGVHAEGPISDPKDIGPALKRAVGVVKRGEPALVDVVTQPR